MVVMTTQAKNTEGGTGQTTASPAVGAASGVVPFTRASNLHREPLGYDVTQAIGTGSTQLPLIQVPAYGFLRHLLLKVIITPTGGTPAFAADGPFNVFSDITLKEPNGNPIYSTDGYGAYLIQKYGGYSNVNDPKQVYGYVNTDGAATFFLRIPLELDVRSALGSVPNQNSSALFQVNLVTNTLANIYSASPTSATVRVVAYQEDWDQPNVSNLGQSNETAPPAVNTTQFWTKQSFGINVGQNNIRMTRVGNNIRNLIFVTRNVSGARVQNMTQLAQWQLDSQVLDIVDRDVQLAAASERYGYTGTLNAAGALDTGVVPYPFTWDFSGKPGFETRNLWLQTLSQSRLELSGTFAAAGVLEVYTNDVVLAGNVQV